MAELDRRLKLADCFTVYNEVEGYYTQPRYDSELITPRIDRLLLPKANLIAAGWRLGAIGIEGKASKKKVGPVVCQALDYARAIFTCPNSFVRVSPSWVFIWPLETMYCSIACLMAQNCIGEAYGRSYEILRLASCGVSFLTVSDRGIEVRNPTRGKRVGSR